MCIFDKTLTKQVKNSRRWEPVWDLMWFIEAWNVCSQRAIGVAAGVSDSLGCVNDSFMVASSKESWFVKSV